MPAGSGAAMLVPAFSQSERVRRMEDWPARFKSRDYKRLSVDPAAYERGRYWAFVIPERDDLARLRTEWDCARIRPHDRSDFSPELLREIQRVLIARLRDEPGAVTENYLTATIFGALGGRFPVNEIADRIAATCACLWGEYDRNALEIIGRARDSTLAAKTAAGFIEGALDVIDAAGLDAPDTSLEATAVVSSFGLVGYLGRRFGDHLEDFIETPKW